MIDRFRSLIFNFLFYCILTPAVCIFMMPALLMPQGATFWVARNYQYLGYLLEKYVMGLDYVVRGAENLPEGGKYLIASKHQSAHETMKLLLIFPNPTIILKKELLYLPLFGWFLKRAGVIAIDRGNRESARKSLIEGAERMRNINRPIVIYPQGTRVPVGVGTDKKPYKSGILKLYEALDVPIVPVALNSGVYWPRNAFWKKSGTVVFEILPPIPPRLPMAEVLRMIETQIETASNRLAQEGLKALSA